MEIQSLVSTNNIIRYLGKVYIIVVSKAGMFLSPK